MKIRTRSRLILIFTIIIFLISLSFITQSVILESFQTIEKQEATANMQRVLSSLHDEVEQVAAQCRARAEWDDTYRFILDQNPDYIRSNLAQPTLFQNLGINYMLFYNSSVIWYTQKATIPMMVQNSLLLRISPAFVRNSIIPEGVPLGISGRRGYSMLNGEPIILVGYDITSSDGTASPDGTLVMVRNFDSERLNYISQQTQLAVTIQQAAKQPDPTIFNETDWEKLMKGAIITKPVNETVMSGFAVVTGIENQPTMLLVNVETALPVYEQVQTSIAIVAAAIVIISILFLLVVQMLLQRFILAPLSTLDNDIKIIGKSGDLSHRIPDKGDEEIASLSHSLNYMIGVIRTHRDDLAAAQKALADRNQDLEQLLEEIQQQRDELHDAREGWTGELGSRGAEPQGESLSRYLSGCNLLRDSQCHNGPQGICRTSQGAQQR